MSLDVSLKCPCCKKEVYESNIAHNLNNMAKAAGIYEYVWRPEEVGIKKAHQLIKPLKHAIREMKMNPVYYRIFDAKNGWGTYEDFLPWLKEYWKACVQHPYTYIKASR